MTDQAALLRNMVGSDVGDERASIGPAPADNVSSTRRGRVSFGPGSERAAPRAGRVQLARAIAVASGKGGVGKSNISINLAIAMAEQGRRVAVFDADLGCANADVLCGVSVKSTLEDVIKGRKRLADIMVAIPGIRGGRGPQGRGGVRLVPGASGVAELASLNATERTGLVEQLAALEQVVDTILIDVGAGIAADAIAFAIAADSVLLTCTPEPTSMTDAYAAAKSMVAARDDVDISLVVNMVGAEEEGLAVHRRMDSVARRHLGRSIPLAGLVPFDFSVIDAVKRRRPLLVQSPDARATRAIRSIGNGLLAETAATERTEAPRGFLSGILRAIGRR
ncbi:MAG: P-loop NTPase [Planctomycetota bacterium]|nr:P-loop NTPase [Planctomycetota bacterium]MEE2894451.1 P-loop NTPase [Planctomycetota bacterium]